MRNQFYRNRYLIALCDTTPLEWMLAVFDNAHEMAEFLGRDVDFVHSTLHRLFMHKYNRKAINYRGRRYNVEFIPLSDKEIKKYGAEKND